MNISVLEIKVLIIHFSICSTNEKYKTMKSTQHSDRTKSIWNSCGLIDYIIYGI